MRIATLSLFAAVGIGLATLSLSLPAQEGPTREGPEPAGPNKCGECEALLEQTHAKNAQCLTMKDHVEQSLCGDEANRLNARVEACLSKQLSQDPAPAASGDDQLCRPPPVCPARVDTALSKGKTTPATDFLDKVGMPLYLPSDYGQGGSLSADLPSGRVVWIIA